MGKLQTLVLRYINSAAELTIQDLISDLTRTPCSQHRRPADVKMIKGSKIGFKGHSKAIVVQSLESPPLFEAFTLKKKWLSDRYKGKQAVRGQNNKEVVYSVTLNRIEIGAYEILQMHYHRISKDNSVISHDGTIHPIP